MAKKKKKRPAEGQNTEKPAPMVLPEGYKLMKPNDTFRYQCSLCGDCCRNVQDSIMLESLDLYRLAKHFRDSGRDAKGIEDVISEYTHPLLLGSIDYYPILLMNTSGPENECIFLKDNRCSAQQAKPRACRLYPMSAGPNNLMNGFEYILVSQKQHHFTGPEIRAGDWMDANFNDEDCAFVMLDIKAARELAPVLRRLKQLNVAEDTVLKPFILYKYILYELDEPFLPQFTRNMAALKNALTQTAARACK
jgi:Fe-S-cluster containining protein